MNVQRSIILIKTVLYVFIIFYIILSYLIIPSKPVRPILDNISQPICVVEINHRYFLLNKNGYIFKISDIPILGFPNIEYNDFLKYKDKINKLTLDELNYISTIDFKNKIIYINPEYKIFYNSWDEVVNYLNQTLKKLEKYEPGSYYLLSGGSLISIY
ncbi:hypothetical protein Marpi_0266 [Marinitoga piezophila KA3]|uniref:Uncharacterized protein n=1 Tax=Marinitoga piezophila (strain DSM 14283 / JCM 11233 / KA3) TaxID=443254 RepID=H2J3Z0_MARPK|nr:DUF4894 domain-containing protein [Marinitoga piezophila]AEX84718.1 hypothetical protein Marpi_0266 [Marinitoga piezophila KA3]